MTAEQQLAAALYARVTEPAPPARLSATTRALARLGNPQRAYRTIHLTGTNGKTSTARITESLQRAHGLRTGMFTSPDLGHITQRICIDGMPVCAELALEGWSEVAEAVARVDAELARDGERPLSFFEALTVLAMYTFAREEVDVGVVEVGRGGAQDATNVIQADVCVLTPIDLDHTAQLGGTIEEIAGVKSGIIKPGCVAISARQTPRAARVLRDAAQRVGAELLVERVDFRVCGREPVQDGQMLEIEGMAGVYDGLALGLSGAHQAQNAALAIAASEAFLSGGRDALSIDTVQRGIACVTSPGRLQRLDSDPVTIADVAHNPHGAAALHAALREQFPACRRVAVIAMLTDKDHAGIFAAMSGLFHEIVITTVPCARAAAPSEIADAAARTGARVTLEVEPRAAIRRARRLARWDGVVTIFGSVTLTSVALEMFNATDPVRQLVSF